LSHHSLRTLRRTAWLAGSAVAAAILLSACASSSGGGGAAPAAGGTSASSSSAGSSAPLTIESHSGPLGTFLTDGKGRTLYMFASDTATKSTCSGQCAVFWPPVVSAAPPTVSGDAAKSDVGTLMLSDGNTQVTYGGHPLYYFKEDTAAGQTNGQGSDQFGAKWWVLGAKGTPITAAAPAAAAGSSGSSSSSSSSGSSAAGGWA
jgi:predicted lipoprotein with Yx(FWY)xxD motif